MPTDPEAQINARIAQLERSRQTIAGSVWAVAGLVILFSLGTGTSLLLTHHVWPGIAWMPSVAADVALVVCLRGDQVLSAAGLRTPGWGVVVRYVAALVTLGLNTTAAVVARDWTSVGIHGAVIVLLIAATEAAQAYVRSFAEPLRRLRADLERIASERQSAVERNRAAEAARIAAERAEEDARRRESIEAQRAAAEAAERASAAAAARASAEAALVLQRAEAERAAADAERQRREAREQERQRRSQQRRAPAPPPTGVRQADVVAAAVKHHEKHGELPSESDLVKQTGASRATAWRALTKAREQLPAAGRAQIETQDETHGLHLVPAATN